MILAILPQQIALFIERKLSTINRHIFDLERILDSSQKLPQVVRSQPRQRETDYSRVIPEQFDID
ncbi:MAG: hypothetical protein GX629_05810 [Phycisphaerae bacterium]|jgi:hypothetical protein|nr:hypothetical protein [Phycisphaerae bacterium]